MSGRRNAARATLGMLLVATAVAATIVAGACRHGGAVRLGSGSPAHGPVAAVLPYEFSDTQRPLPDGALLCYADSDCVVHVVRECCPGCRPQHIAVNAAARNAITRYHDTHPCPPTGPCPDPACAEVEGIPTASCLKNRCTIAW